MTVRKIKGQWYVDAYVKRPGRPPVRLRKRAPVQTKRDAEAYEKVLLSDVHGLTDRPQRTFRDFVETDFATYVRTHNRASEQESKSAILRLHLVPFFGRMFLRDITTREIELYAAEKARETKGVRTLSPKSINNHLTVLRKALMLAHQYEEIERVPALRWRKVPQQKYAFFDVEQSRRLIANADPGLWRAMITVALHTGLRRGELFGLEWRDVDFENRRLTVERAVVRDKEGPTKNGKIRHVPLSRDAIAALQSVRGTVPIVFHIDGERITRNKSKHPLWRACRRAKLPLCQWHVLRHSFASHLAMGGVQMRSIMELMGHQSMGVTLRYAHLTPQTLADAIAKLEGPHLGNATTDRSGKASNDKLL